MISILNFSRAKLLMVLPNVLWTKHADRTGSISNRRLLAPWMNADVLFAMTALPFAEIPALLHDELKQEAICNGNRLAKDLRNVFYSLWVEDRVCRLLAEFQPDVVYYCYALFGTAGLEIGRRLPLPPLV